MKPPATNGQPLIKTPAATKSTPAVAKRALRGATA
jgi:hypothetical protein